MQFGRAGAGGGNLAQDANSESPQLNADHARVRALEIRGAQINQLYEQAGTGLIAALVGVIVLVAALWNVVEHEWLLAWVGLIIPAYAIRYVLVRAYLKAPPTPNDAEPWGRRFAVGVVATSFLWGASAAVFFPSDSLLHQFLLILCVSALGCGAAIAYSPLKEAYIPSVLLVLLPLSIRLLYEGGDVHAIVGLVGPLFAAVLLIMGRHANAHFLETLRLRFEKSDFADSLEIARQDLEHRVNERTAELARANEELRSEIAERKAAEAALRESEEKYRVLVQTSLQGISVVQDDVIVLVNRSTVRFLGYSEEEILGSEYARFVHPDDRPMIKERYAKQFRGEKVPRRFTYRALNQQGQTLWVDAETLVTTWQGKPALLLFAADATDRKHAEDELRRTSERFRAVFETAADCIYIKDRDLRYVLVNPAVERLFGMSAAKLVGMTDEELFGEEWAKRIHEDDRRVLEGQVFTEEHERPVLGVLKEFSVVKVPLRDESGEIVGLCGIARDVTERNSAERALRESEATLKGVLRATPLGVGLMKDHRVIAWVNDGLCKISGHSADELVGRSARTLYETDDEYERVGRVKYPQIEARGWGTVESRWKRKDGEVIEVFLSSAAVEPGNLAAGVVFAAVDITDRKRAERALVESEEKYRALVDRAPIGILSVDTEGRILEVNRKLLEILGSPDADSTREINMFTFPLLVEAGISEVFQRCVREERSFEAERPYVSKWGKQVHFRVLLEPIRDSEGTVRGCQAVVEDITEQKRAEAELVASEEKLRLIIDSSPVGIGIAVDGRYAYVNPAFVRIFGYESANEIVGVTVGSFAIPEDAERIRDLVAGVAAEAQSQPHFQATNVRKDGSKWSGEGWITNIQYEGKPASLLFVTDVTEARSLRSQLLHAQKMEAVGTLAGGIAHDFNNLLSVVLGYSELLLADKSPDDPEYEDLMRIANTARNGADLVQRILTFSRKVETRPRPVNLNSIVKQAEQLLRRTIPRIIELELGLGTDLKIVNADPGQIEQVLLNLALNAKDAMPDGGRLVIETANVAVGEEFCKTHLGAVPGEYVMIKVTDTGPGIESHVLEHIFEPFYTTKGVGEGSGLGLAMVYGIVTGHGGYIECHSTLGSGTTFVMHFPVLHVEEQPRVQVPQSQPEGGKETILVVDDEDFIRELCRRILSRAGYKVLVASNGREALEIYKQRQNEIGLVILDLIMPVMEGGQCLDHLIEINSQVKVLIATGFWPTGVARTALEAKAKGFVSKPYDIVQVLREVRKVLDQE